MCPKIYYTPNICTKLTGTRSILTYLLAILVKLERGHGSDSTGWGHILKEKQIHQMSSLGHQDLSWLQMVMTNCSCRCGERPIKKKPLSIVWLRRASSATQDHTLQHFSVASFPQHRNESLCNLFDSSCTLICPVMFHKMLQKPQTCLTATVQRRVEDLCASTGLAAAEVIQLLLQAHQEVSQTQTYMGSIHVHLQENHVGIFRRRSHFLQERRSASQHANLCRSSAATSHLWRIKRGNI